MSKDHSPRPRRRWFQLSLRTLLLFMVLVCTFFAGRASRDRELNRLRAETEADRAQAQTSQQQIIRVQWPSLQQIEEGMKADALQRQQQVPIEVIPR
jgi:hypothetical protein